jgi:hypothetical protein
MKINLKKGKILSRVQNLNNTSYYYDHYIFTKNTATLCSVFIIKLIVVIRNSCMLQLIKMIGGDHGL